MEMLITLSLRPSNLTSGQDCQSVERLLKAAPESTLQWISRLCKKVRNAAEAGAAERAARYGFCLRKGYGLRQVLYISLLPYLVYVSLNSYKQDKLTQQARVTDGENSLVVNGY
jgi:hypothetical protein